MKPSVADQAPVPARRKRESDAQYAARCLRWTLWKAQEPRPNHSYTDDTEVAEYRAWAGTTKLHDRLVDDLIKIAEGKS